MNTPKKVFLLDSYALIYRAHFALHQYTRTNSQGLEVGALLGFANTVVELLQKQASSHVIAVFDTHAESWRKKVYPEYKSQREKQPEAITRSIPHSKELLEGLGIPYISMKGYEADDVIGTLAVKAAKKGFTVYIVSLDKDFGQLVNEEIQLYKPGRRGQSALIWGKQEVLDHWGVQCVTQIRDIIALWGDSSDNIPGVPQIGPKKAQKLIGHFGSVERLFKDIERLEAPLQRRLAPFAEQAFLSKKLATIATDLTLPESLDSLISHCKKPDPLLLKPLLEQLEFNALAKRLFSQEEITEGGQLSLFATTKKGEKAMGGTSVVEAQSLKKYDAAHSTYQSVEEIEAFSILVGKLRSAKVFSFDTETTGLDPHRATLLGISFSFKEKEAFFVPIFKLKQGKQDFLTLLSGLLSDMELLKIGQNLKYDLLVLARAGIIVRGPFFDTMIAHHLLQPDAPHHLTALAKEFLGYEPIDIEMLIGGKKGGQKCLDEVPFRDLLVYACEDADITLQLYGKLAPLLVQKEVDRLFYDVEMRLLPVLVHMEKTGIAVDTAVLQDISACLVAEIKKMEAEVYDLAGSTFNISSPKQLGEILFDKLSITDKPIKTSKGQYATNERVLGKLANKHPIVALVLGYRQLKKLKSTYVDALPTLLGPDRRIHTSYHQGLVSTGRLSSSNPNLQNIPIRTERGKLVRKAFVPGRSDQLLISADYSQIELRIMAHFSGDRAMVSAFQRGEDIHTATAAQVFGVNENEVTSLMRRKAKMVNFGIIYGVSAFGLAERLGISRREAGAIIENYFSCFPSIKGYMEETVRKAKEKGYVTTMLGRKRFLPDIYSSNRTMRGFAERNAINMPIQGSAAELIQCAMINIDDWLQRRKIPVKMLLQVHDELVFEVDMIAIDEVKEQIPILMAQALPFDVPIVVSLGIGKNWLEAHE